MRRNCSKNSYGRSKFIVCGKKKVTWEGYRNIDTVSRNATRKDKDLLKLNLAKEAKDNKKGFFKSSVLKERPGKTWACC